MTGPDNGHDDDGDLDAQQALFESEPPEGSEGELGFYVTLLRSYGYQVKPPNPKHKFRVRADAPETSHLIEPVLRADSLAAQIYTRFFADGSLYTCDEIERITGRAHQSASAAINTLMRRGLVTDSDTKRRTRYGNWAILWQRTRRSRGFRVP
jgi:hypothetical protein